MKLLAAVLATSAAFVGANAGNITASVNYADEAWNCNGDAPPCPTCSSRVPSGTMQSPYGCAPFVSHILVAGGFIPGLDRCGGLDPYSSYSYGGKHYNLNVVKHEDPNCGGGLCLFDLLLAMGWTKASSVVAGVACAVNGGDGDYTHTAYAVGSNICDAHNAAHLRVPCTTWQINLCLKPPGMTIRNGELVEGSDEKETTEIATLPAPAPASKDEDEDKEEETKHKERKGKKHGGQKTRVGGTKKAGHKKHQE